MTAPAMPVGHTGTRLFDESSGPSAGVALKSSGIAPKPERTPAARIARAIAAAQRNHFAQFIGLSDRVMAEATVADRVALVFTMPEARLTFWERWFIGKESDIKTAVIRLLRSTPDSDRLALAKAIEAHPRCGAFLAMMDDELGTLAIARLIADRP
ncbi:MAG: hypothetical protein AAB426_12725 [Myxococcota bacterium]